MLESTTWPGTTRELLQPILEEGSGLDGGRGLLPRHVAGAGRPGPRGLDDEDDAEGARRDHAAVHRAARPSSTGARSTRCTRSRARRRPSSRSCSRTSSARSTSRSSTSSPSSATGWGSTSGRSSTPPRRSRSASCASAPGPGLGGHCIPIDPFYLSWKAREFGFYTEFIELAGKVNEEMPYFCRSLVSQALNHHAQRAMKGSRILVLGVAYKPDIGDLRESPALKLISLLQNAGAEVSYHDPHVPEIDEQGVELSSVAYEPQALRLRRHRHRPLLARLRRARRRSAARRRPPQRDRRQGQRGGERLQAVSRLRVGQAGLGYWGRNLARNFDDLADLRWLCDASEERRRSSRERYPNARVTGDFEEMLAADDARRRRDRDARFPRTTRSRTQALEAGKHVFVEKPPAMRAAEMEELVGLAEAGGLVLMPGHLLLYHPAVQKLKELIDDGRARRRARRLREPSEPRQDPQGRERALVARRPRPLGDPVPDLTRRSSRRRRTATPSSTRASRTSSSATCASRRGRSRTCTSRGSTRTRCGGSRSSAATRWPSSTTWSSTTRSRSTTRRPSSRPTRTANGGPAPATRSARSSRTPSRCKLECAHFLQLVQEGWDGREMRDGLEVVRALELLTESLHVD